MDYSCSQAGNCGIRTPFTQWNDIGYENGNGGLTPFVNKQLSKQDKERL
jgi:hypothetical protein